MADNQTKRYNPQNVKQRDGDPILSNQFEVYFGNNTKIGFSRVSNISMSEDVDSIKDSGNDDNKYIFIDRDDRVGDNVLILERGVGTDKNDKLLRTYMNGLKFETLLIKINQNGKSVRMLSVRNPIISKFGYSDLDASGSSVLMRRIEITHDGIEEIDVDE